MDNPIEVIFALIAILSVGAERAAEVLGPSVFGTLKRYFGIDADSKDIRTVVMVLLVFLLNISVMAGFDLDIVAKLMNDNSTIFTIMWGAFLATGLSAYSHELTKFFTGKNAKLVDVLQAVLDAAKADQQPEA